VFVVPVFIDEQNFLFCRFFSIVNYHDIWQNQQPIIWHFVTNLTIANRYVDFVKAKYKLAIAAGLEESIVIIEVS
jgi:hypothetical protein